MFLHIYSRGELISELQAAGFEQLEILPVNLQGSALMKSSRMLEYCRAGGFLRFAGRSLTKDNRQRAVYFGRRNTRPSSRRLTR